MSGTFLTSNRLPGYGFTMLGHGCPFLIDCGKGLSTGRSRQRCFGWPQSTFWFKVQGPAGLLNAKELIEKWHFSELSVNELKTHGFNAPWNKYRFKKNGEESKCFGRTFFWTPNIWNLFRQSCSIQSAIYLFHGDGGNEYKQEIQHLSAAVAFQKGIDQQHGFQETAFEILEKWRFWFIYFSFCGAGV